MWIRAPFHGITFPPPLPSNFRVQGYLVICFSLYLLCDTKGVEKCIHILGLGEISLMQLISLLRIYVAQKTHKVDIFKSNEPLISI